MNILQRTICGYSDVCYVSYYLAYLPSLQQAACFRMPQNLWISELIYIVAILFHLQTHQSTSVNLISRLPL